MNWTSDNVQKFKIYIQNIIIKGLGLSKHWEKSFVWIIMGLLSKLPWGKCDYRKMFFWNNLPMQLQILIIPIISDFWWFSFMIETNFIKELFHILNYFNFYENQIKITSEWLAFTFFWLYPFYVLHIQVQRIDVFWEVQELLFHECPLRTVTPAIFTYAFVCIYMYFKKQSAISSFTVHLMVRLQ
jgi:hypothetical protein